MPAMPPMPDDLADIVVQMLRRSIVRVDCDGTTISVSAGPIHVAIDAAHVRIEAGCHNYAYPVPVSLAQERAYILAEAKHVRDDLMPPLPGLRASDIRRLREIKRFEELRRKAERDATTPILPLVGTTYRRKSDVARAVVVARVYRIDDTSQWFVDAEGSERIGGMPAAVFLLMYTTDEAPPTPTNDPDSSDDGCTEPTAPAFEGDPADCALPPAGAFTYEWANMFASELYDIAHPVDLDAPRYDLADLLIALARGD